MAQQKKDQSVSKKGSTLNVVKWLLAFLLVFAAGLINSWYAETIPLLYRFIGVISAVLIALFIASTTHHGSAFVKLIKEARIEVKKVVWPTRHESLVTSGFVVLAVTIFSILLWAIDSLLRLMMSAVLG